VVQIFGTNCIGGEAEACTKYWRELNIYEEKLQVPECVVHPQGILYSHDLMYIYIAPDSPVGSDASDASLSKSSQALSLGSVVEVILSS